MAEMRKGGLRGRVLQHSGVILNPEATVSFGDMLEMSGEGEGAVVGGKGEGGPDGVVAGMEKEKGLGEMVVKQIELVPAGNVSDLALDIISSQPLQEMEFIGRQVVLEEKTRGDGMDCLMLESTQLKEKENMIPEGGHCLREEVVEEFPPLCKDRRRGAKGKEIFRGEGGKEVPRVEELPTKIK